MRPTTPNILRVFDSATQSQLEAGMTWYADAYNLATQLDPEDPRRGAAVIAVLSPLKSWSENIRLARLAYANRGLTWGTLKDHVNKVNRLMQGESPETVVSGNKVVAFFNGIAANGETDIVTIDRHAFDVAVGKRNTDQTRGQISRRGRGGYADCERAYVRAARARGVFAAQVQAVTWVAWRAEHGGKRK